MGRYDYIDSGIVFPMFVCVMHPYNEIKYPMIHASVVYYAFIAMGMTKIYSSIILLYGCGNHMMCIFHFFEIIFSF